VKNLNPYFQFIFDNYFSMKLHAYENHKSFIEEVWVKIEKSIEVFTKV